MAIFVSIIWLLTEIKNLLFWFYLWQLKQYHLDRFADHFRTEKGKKLLFGPLPLLKPLLFLLFFVWQGFAYFVLLVFILQASLFFKNLFQKTLKKPDLTVKTGFLLLISAAFLFLILFYLLNFNLAWQKLAIWFLAIDILSPLLFSFLVLLFQPISVFYRHYIIKKAKTRREELENLLVVAITGSFGKTSTKEFLAAILSEKFSVIKTENHLNTVFGIARTILKNIKKEHQVFVCEIGAYDLGQIKEVCGFLMPKIGILTGINQQHMSTFGSQENIISAKFELIESLPENGTAILNWDNDLIIQNSKIKSQNENLKCKIIKYSASKREDIWAEDIKVEKESISFRVFSKDGDSTEFKLNLLGAQNVSNILAAVACAKELGMSLVKISRACQKIKPEQSGLKLIKTKSGLNLIDSSYSANPDGVIADLEYLKLWQGKRILIMPCLIELSSASAEVHKKIGRKIAEVCDLAIITTKDYFKEIKQNEDKIILIERPREIIEKLRGFCGAGDTVLLEGRVPKEIIRQLINV